MNNFGTGFAVGFLTAAALGGYDAIKRRKKIADLSRKIMELERETNLRGYTWRHGDVRHEATKPN